MEEIRKYGLYWIRYIHHLNPYQDGYIGITSQRLEDRIADHRYNRKNKHLRNRCSKGDIIYSFLKENLTKEEARFEELLYRPLKYIGWNINIGGDLPPSRKGTCGPRRKGNDRTELQKVASKRHSEWMQGRPSLKKGKRYTSAKICQACSIEYYRHSTKSKFCSQKCAGIVNKDPNKIKQFSERRMGHIVTEETRKKISQTKKASRL